MNKKLWLNPGWADLGNPDMEGLDLECIEIHIKMVEGQCKEECKDTDGTHPDLILNLRISNSLG